MNTLFPDYSVYPEGFIYHPDFITQQEESELLKEIEKLNLHTFIFQGYSAKRKVASFGFDWNFETRTLSKGVEIPSVFTPLIKRVASFIQKDESTIAELLVTEYPIDSVINWHRDAPPFDIIAGISLLSDCRFKLKPHEKAKQTKASTITIPVKRRSIYVLKGEARENWQHSISPVKERRVSITVRTLK